MANTTVELLAPPGQTLTLELYALGSDVLANSGGADTLIEEANRHGLYTATVTESLAGWYSAHILNAGDALIAVGYVFLSDDTGTYRVMDAVDIPQTGDSFARLGEPAGDSIAADIAAIPAAPVATAIADAVLSRSVSNVETTMPEHSLGTIILQQLESSVSSNTLTILGTDGVTTRFSKTVTTNAQGQITGVS